MTKLFHFRQNAYATLLCLLSLFSLQIVKAQIITTIAGNGSLSYSGDGGPAQNAALYNPQDICLDANSNIYIADYSNHRIRKIDASTGIITIIAGNGTDGYSGDGGLAINASIGYSNGVCIDATGNLYVACTFAHRVRKINLNTGIITTVAGNGTQGYSGDGGLATNASLYYPDGIYIDPNSNLYIADDGNNRIRKVDATTGIITTIAGNGIEAHSGDGSLATNASFISPRYICMDKDKNLYIATSGGGQCYIRKIDAVTNIITTVAGNGIVGSSGDGGLATNASIFACFGIAIDANQNIYIADYYGNRIRKISTTTGIITTVVGDGNSAYNGDDGPAISASINKPAGIKIDDNGNLYIADQSNNRIRKVTATCAPTITINTSANNICGNIPVTFTATVTNEGTVPVYQWKNNGTNVGTNSPTYSTTSSMLTNNDIIECTLTSNAACATTTNITSNAITIALIPPQSPQNTEVVITASSTEICAGTSIIFTATNKSNSYAPSYQWLVNGTNVGTNSTTFTTNGLNNGDMVQCKMSVPECNNNNGGTKNYSDPIPITVKPVSTPSITISPNITNSCQGKPITFKAIGINAGNNPIYEWKVNGNNVGPNSATYTTSGLQNGDKVSCIMYIDPSLACAASTNTTSNIVVMNVNANVTPSINITNSANNSCFGQPVTFTATPTNSGTSPVFQWKANSTNVGTNSTTYTSTTLNNGDIVSCELTSNAACATTPTAISNPITMAVTQDIPPVVTIQASTLSVCFGSSVTFTATNQSNSPNPSYQWQVNGTNMGSNTTSFTTDDLNSNATVQCIMTTPHCTNGTTKDVSDPITIMVHPFPVITFNPEAIEIQAGKQTTLNAKIAGTTSSYEWTPANALKNITSLTPVTIALQSSTTFQLKARSTDGCEAYKSITVKVIKKLYMPNFFSPNNDGINDIFRIPPGTTLTLKDFSVFNRWGNLVFTTNDISKGWNGEYKNKPASEGNYVYSISGTTPKGNIHVNSTVMLLR